MRRAMHEWGKLLKGLEVNPAASDLTIARVEKALGVVLPADYQAFLRHSNGACGNLGGAAYTDLWTAEDVTEFTKRYREIVPELVFIGTDGGGQSFAFHFGLKGVPIVCVLDDDLIDSAPRVCAHTFRDFLVRLAESRISYFELPRVVK